MPTPRKCSNVRISEGIFSADALLARESEALIDVAKYVLTHSSGAHPFKVLGEFVDYNIDFGIGGLDFDPGPVEALKTYHKGICTTHAYTLTSLLLAVGYEAVVVYCFLRDEEGNLTGGHCYTEAMAEDNRWYLIESCFGSVSNYSPIRPDYYEDFYAYNTPYGCFSSDNRDDMPDGVPQMDIDTEIVELERGSIYITVMLREMDTEKGIEAALINASLIRDGQTIPLGKHATGRDGYLDIFYPFDAGDILILRYDGLDALRMWDMPSPMIHSNEVMHLFP